MKLVGPLRKESVSIRFRVREREVLLDKLYDPEDQLQLMAKAVVSRKLEVFALQLAYMGCSGEHIEGLARKLVSLERFDVTDLCRFLDIVMLKVGNLHDPLFVIDAIADNVTKFQPDSNHAVVMAGVLIQDFASMDDPKKERDFAAALKGN
ncbi:MAG TPA: hypothetical protein VLD37_01135 [Candidatus Bilamarchaeum sp.]|nr:hypothetical protein [Candidatus Bilamarchaeum sp.]